TIMSDSEDSTVTYTSISRTLCGGRSPGPTISKLCAWPGGARAGTTSTRVCSRACYVSKSDHEEDPDDDEDPKEDLADYPADRGDDGDDKDEPSDDDEDEEVNIEADDNEE
ncbi:hypothetical protein Tco_0756290, partial [Tanacetum coccineum]